MDNRELALSYIRILTSHECKKHPVDMEKGTKGMNFILVNLYKSECEVTAGMLADELCVSTARIAVLLTKLEEKGFVTKSSSASDKRKTIVVLTEEGKKRAVEIMNEGIDHMVMLIEKIGKEDMDHFFSTLQKIYSVDCCKEVKE